MPRVDNTSGTVTLVSVAASDFYSIRDKKWKS